MLKSPTTIVDLSFFPLFCHLPSWILKPCFWYSYIFSSVSSVTLWCLTLCDPMNCSKPGLPVHHQLPEFTQTHLHGVGDAIQISQYFPASGSFQMSQFFASGGQSIRVSVSASVLLMNIQDWLPLGWTVWISLQAKELSKSSLTPQFKSINSSALSFLYSPTLTFIHDDWKNHSFD